MRVSGRKLEPALGEEMRHVGEQIDDDGRNMMLFGAHHRAREQMLALANMLQVFTDHVS